MFEFYHISLKCVLTHKSLDDLTVFVQAITQTHNDLLSIECLGINICEIGIKT